MISLKDDDGRDLAVFYDLIQYYQHSGIQVLDIVYISFRLQFGITWGTGLGIVETAVCVQRSIGQKNVRSMGRHNVGVHKFGSRDRCRDLWKFVQCKVDLLIVTIEPLNFQWTIFDKGVDRGVFEEDIFEGGDG